VIGTSTVRTGVPRWPPLSPVSKSWCGMLPDVDRWRTASPYLLAGLLAVAGTSHLAWPQAYDGLVPPFLPGSAKTWTLVSGGAELAVAAGVAAPRTRRRGGLAAAVLFVAVFPGNLWMVVEPGSVPRWAALARLPLQVPLVLWGLQVAGFLPSTRRRA
jgi:uncharacterized membrane protein